MDSSKNLSVSAQNLEQVASPNDVVAPGKGTRNSRQSGSANDNGHSIDYAGLGISPSAVASFEEARELFASLGRKRTEEVFTCGEMLAKVRGKSPSQEAFDSWSKQACRLTRRGAANYIAVHSHLRAHRKILVDCSVPAAAMYVLATAESETVSSVVKDLKAGKRPTVREFKVLVSGETHTAQPDPADVGGANGLKTLARAKAESGVLVLTDRLRWILEDIQAALEPHFAGKKVSKGALAAKVEHSARRANSELQNLALFVVPNPEGSETWRLFPAIFPHESKWRKVTLILYTLGGRDDWPDASGLGDWLVKDVVPALEFAVGAKPSKGASKE
ncbi:hypothetical protein [Mesorhizobium sp.]|uniref:hypothetical protein n=1 Tax=Mesorhizobium sp. TaxID=1871066 RepID=UPI0025D20117|nr:hypothetical protein [Mesorhizobium sp.]